MGAFIVIIAIIAVIALIILIAQTGESTKRDSTTYTPVRHPTSPPRRAYSSNINNSSSSGNPSEARFNQYGELE
jgi:hypothetical protein